MSNKVQRVLVTGGTGYIGGYVAKMLAATYPNIEVWSMSRQPVQIQKDKDPQLARFPNVRHIQGDCLKPGTFPSDKELASCDAIVHTVGALIEGVDYKGYLSGAKNPLQSFTQCAQNRLTQAITSNVGSSTYQSGSSSSTPYDETLEAKNRDACKLMAEYYNLACKKEGKDFAHFVFLSAAPSIAPLLKQYIRTKEEAENFLLHNCPNITPVILKPGLVWHEKERSWSVPLKLASDFGYQLNKNFISKLPGNQLVQPLLPQSESIHLRVLADFIIKGALGELDQSNPSKVWSNEQMNRIANNSSTD